MKYSLIILFVLSLPATALFSTSPKNTSEEFKRTVTPIKNNQKVEELRKMIQMKIRHDICDPSEELKMPTFY